MSSKVFICAIFLFVYISIWCSCNGDTIAVGVNPNVTGLTPNVSISRTIYLYGTGINISFTVYQLPVNNTLQETLRVINGSTNINSTNLCIAYGVSFQIWGQYPIINSQATGNGGCDAILGSQCSQSISNALQQSFGDINSTACGVRLSGILTNPPQGCPPVNTTSSSISSSAFLNNGSFMLNGSATNSSTTWIYDESDPSVNGDYDELMKYFVFIYFVGRPYFSGIIDTAIACFSIYNATVEPTIASTTTQLTVSGNFLILLSLSYVFFRFMVCLP